MADRRDLLKTAAFAGGLVWTRPALRTVELFGAGGTAAPQSTTTTIGGPTTITFTGPLDTSEGGDRPDPDCADFVLAIIGATDVSTLGHLEVELLPCVDFPSDADGTYHVVGGRFVLTATNGTLTGSTSGTFGPTPATGAPPLPIHLALHITGGTGAFAGAIGNATYEGQLLELWLSSGTLAGSFDLPN